MMGGKILAGTEFWY